MHAFTCQIFLLHETKFQENDSQIWYLTLQNIKRYNHGYIWIFDTFKYRDTF